MDFQFFNRDTENREEKEIVSLITDFADLPYESIIAHLIWKKSEIC